MRCLIYEDEHLLVINKPAGINTHAPDPHANEGLYDWLRNREPRWAKLAIIHRLDKETSGILVFSKSTLANRSLTDQFAARNVRKTYLLLSRGKPAQPTVLCRSSLVRSGDKYLSRPVHAGSAPAETEFQLLPKSSPLDVKLPAPLAGLHLIQARPLTGRTHQIRVHAAQHGFSILGDTLYGGPAADRVYLHAAQIDFLHPASGQPVSFRAPWPLDQDPRLALRFDLIDPALTNCCRLIHGASDAWPGWYVDQLGDFLLSQSAGPLTPHQQQRLAALLQSTCTRGAAHKILSRQVRRTTTLEASPQPVAGETAPEHFLARENGVNFELSFAEGYSVGLFLDQRDNRRRLLTGHIGAGFPLHTAAPGGAPPELLNTFAYTCGFSVCAALAGFRTTSLDLSKKYLDWGWRNLVHNGRDPAEHDFIFGDVFDWLRRLGKKGRRFDVVLLDPPTFTQSRQSGVFRADRDYGKLVQTALTVLKPNGVLFASSNAADWPASVFEETVRQAVRDQGRAIQQRLYIPQPLDFPISRPEPAYLKTTWLRLT